MPFPFRRSKGAGYTAAAAAGLALVTLSAQVVFASHPEVSLSGSDFEIDTNANLVVDDAAPSIDWANVVESRKQDKASGQNDDSFGQGTKEDTAVPTVVAGSIPPNKSDLKYFGAYQEGTSSGGFLHLYWTRVQDPTGTTNMDFEFNQSKVKSANGVTPVRSVGDLLITYDLSNGGSKPTLGKRVWDGTQWGPYTAFSDAVAAGSINSTAITAANADGLGSLSARTFGEASIRLSAILGTGTCTTFGSAYLKSRSSDTFSSALKDFIEPQTINVTNCGSITINKKDDAGNILSGAGFTLYNDNGTIGGTRSVTEDTVTDPALTCTTDTAGTCTISNVPFGSYWVVETSTPAGYQTASDASTSITAASSSVTLNIVDPRLTGAIRVTKTFKDHSAADGSSPHAGVTFTVSGNGIDPVPGTTNNNGVVCFDGLLQGDYTVTETVPANFKAAGDVAKQVPVNNAATCGPSYVGETVAFVNTPLSNVVVSFESPVPGVSGPATASTIDCSQGTSAIAANTPDTTPNAYDDVSERFNGLAPGTYTCTVVIDP